MKFTQYINEAQDIVKQWNHYVKSNIMINGAVSILNKITKKGYSAYIVGGGVRDIILGIEPHDIDICTNMPIDEIAVLWKVYDIGKSKDFGIVTIREKGINYEISQFRKDGKYKDGRRPESVQIEGSFKEDAARRDFTINAMGINVKGEIIDYFDGTKDIKNKVLKAVGDPKKRFGEDALRMLRAARFSSKLDLDIEKDTKKSIKKLSINIKKLSPERIKDELMKAANQSGDKFAVYIKILDSLKLLKFILPEVENLKGYKHDNTHHPEGGPWEHTMKALEVNNLKDPIKNLAIILHDIGKGVTLSHKEGLPKYYEHAKKSMDLVDAIADRLKFSNKERQALIFAVGNHMKFHDILKMKPSKIAKLVSDENWDVLVAVGKADSESRGPNFKHAGEFEKIVDKAIEIKNKFGMKIVNKQLKMVDGKDVMEWTGLKPGPKVGEIIKDTTEWILDNEVMNKSEIENYIKDKYK